MAALRALLRGRHVSVTSGTGHGSQEGRGRPHPAASAERVVRGSQRCGGRELCCRKMKSDGQKRSRAHSAGGGRPPQPPRQQSRRWCGRGAGGRARAPLAEVARPMCALGCLLCQDAQDLVITIDVEPGKGTDSRNRRNTFGKAAETSRGPTMPRAPVMNTLSPNSLPL
jgi:hypothetical protein